MSFEAVNWALAQSVGKSSAKFVLVVMGKLAGADMKCWPSAKHLAKETEQDVKTVVAGIKRLRDGGFIEDTGERRGDTGQVIVYRLNSPKSGVVTTPPNTPENGSVDGAETHPFFPHKPPKNGAVAQESKTPVFPVKDTRFSAKDTRFSRVTHPKTGDGQVNDKSDKSMDKEIQGDDLFGGLLADVDVQVLADFKALRKDRKAKLTETAVAGLAREAAKAGLSMTDALRMCCERGWIGFKADWIANQARGRTPTNTGRHSGFDQRDYEGAPDGSIPA